MSNRAQRASRGPRTPGGLCVASADIGPAISNLVAPSQNYIYLFYNKTYLIQIALFVLLFKTQRDPSLPSYTMRYIFGISAKKKKSDLIDQLND